MWLKWDKQALPLLPVRPSIASLAYGLMWYTNVVVLWMLPTVSSTSSSSSATFSFFLFFVVNPNPKGVITHHFDVNEALHTQFAQDVRFPESVWFLEGLKGGDLQGGSCAKKLQALTMHKSVLFGSFDKFSTEPKMSHKNSCWNMPAQGHTELLWRRRFPT